MRSSKVWKKSLSLTFVVFLFLAVLWTPILNSIHENFDFYISQAFQSNPDLVNNFYRERSTSLILLAASLVITLSVIFIYSLRFFSRIENSLSLISDHFSDLQRGIYNTTYASTENHPTELSELVHNIDGLHLHLIENIQKDIEFIESLPIASTDYFTRTKVDNWLQSKRKQIGQSTLFGNIIHFPDQHKDKKSA